MMKKLALLLVIMGMVSGCGLTKKDLGMARPTPDETQVSRRERLVIPPDYDIRPAQTTVATDKAQ